MKMIKLIWKRLTSKTPKFFKYIRNLAIALAISAGAALSLYGTWDEKVKEVIPIEFIKTLGVTALVTTFIAQLPVEDKDKKDGTNT